MLLKRTSIFCPVNNSAFRRITSRFLYGYYIYESNLTEALGDGDLLRSQLFEGRIKRIVVISSRPTLLNPLSNGRPAVPFGSILCCRHVLTLVRDRKVTLLDVPEDVILIFRPVKSQTTRDDIAIT